MENLINSLELYVELAELKKLDISDDEILGFIDMYYENWLGEEMKENLIN